jgi:hypothetical protein
MAARIAFLVRSHCILPILLSVICLLVPAEAQHGGGGGHSGGGHSGGGHSGGGHSGRGHSGGGHASGGHSPARHYGGGHAGGRFGWLHFWSGTHSARRAAFGASSTSDTSPHLLSHLWNIPTPARAPRIPPTLLWSPPLLARRPDGNFSFLSSHVRPHRGLFFYRFPRFSSSGCFFNGVTQVCFFEPFLPLLSCSGNFDPFYPGFGGESLNLGDDLNSQGPAKSEMSAIPPPANPSGDDTAEGNSSVRPGATLGAATENYALGKGVFLLVLKNGTSHAVTDYWVADGYLEYISPDGTRSHIPLEALDLQGTVTRNAPRGLPFVLRSAPTGDVRQR